MRGSDALSNAVDRIQSAGRPDERQGDVRSAQRRYHVRRVSPGREIKAQPKRREEGGSGCASTAAPRSSGSRRGAAHTRKQNTKYEIRAASRSTSSVLLVVGSKAHTHPLAGRISWLRRVRLENPLGHGNFLSGLKLSGERDGGLGLARFSAVCPLGGYMYANGL
jgi:hypothetical protein